MFEVEGDQELDFKYGEFDRHKNVKWSYWFGNWNRHIWSSDNRFQSTNGKLNIVTI
jgi:hypothetical protein